MKILQVMAHSYCHGYAGGGQKVFFSLGNAFAERGHIVTSIYSDHLEGKPFFSARDDVNVINLNINPKGNFHLLWKFLKEITYQCRKTRFRKFFIEPVQRVKQHRISKGLKEVLRVESPDIVIAYNIQDLNALDFAKCEIPILLMSHSDVNVIYKNLYFDELSRINSCKSVQALTPYFSERFSKLLGREVVYIPNIVPQFSDCEINIRNEKKGRRKRIIMISRLDRKKQQHMLVESFALLQDKYPDWDVAIFGGELTKGYESHLNNLVENNNLKNRIFVSGATDQVYDELLNSDIFAFPSIHEEGFPLALTEAMATGLPCVGINTTQASKFLISDFDAGYLSNNDIDDFAQSLEKLMKDDDLRLSKSINARQAMKQYSMKSICEQWEVLIKSAVNKK